MEACVILGVERQQLRKRMLEFGVKKWPHRKYIKSNLPKPKSCFVEFQIKETQPKEERNIPLFPLPYYNPYYKSIVKEKRMIAKLYRAIRPIPWKLVVSIPKRVPREKLSIQNLLN